MKAQFAVVLLLALGFSACAKKQKAVMLNDAFTEQAVASSEGTAAAAAAEADERSTVERNPIYFDYNSSELSDASRNHLTKLAQAMNRDGAATVRIEGNTDARGSTEFNLALGERRASAARDYLKRLGVDSKRVSLVSYGEERPAVPGDDEAAWSRNRRDEFLLSK